MISHRLRALVQKELNQIKRDRRIMMSLILPPILQLMLFGSVMNPSVANVNLGILDDSQSPASRDLVAALSESGSFKLKRRLSIRRRARRRHQPGRHRCGRRDPVGFRARSRPRTTDDDSGAAERDEREHRGDQPGLRAGRRPELQRDAAERPVRPSMHVDQGPRPRAGRALLHPALLYNPGGVSTWFIVTGLLGTLLIMNGTITASTTMVKEREAGTLEQLLMTPAGMTEIIVAKIVPPFVLLAIPASMALIVIHFYFGVPFNGSAPLIAVSSALCLLCGIGIGTAVATITKSAQQAQLATFFITPPLMSLSGAMSPAEAMPSVDAALDRAQSRLPLRRDLARQLDQGRGLRRALAASRWRFWPSRSCSCR